VNEEKWTKKSTWIPLDNSPLFFHTVSKLVQAFVITYDEIFQALAVEGDVLLPKPFLDNTPPTVQPRLGPLGTYVFGKLKNISTACDFHLTTPSKPRSRRHVWVITVQLHTKNSFKFDIIFALNWLNL
jgi:hypothetical protein